MESMVCKHSTWPAKSRFKTTVNVRKVTATILCNIKSIILVDFMPYGMMVTAAAYQAMLQVLNFWHLTSCKHTAKCHTQNNIRLRSQHLRTFLMQISFKLQASTVLTGLNSGAEGLKKQYDITDLACLPEVCCYCMIMLGHILIMLPMPCQTSGTMTLFPTYLTAQT